MSRSAEVVVEAIVEDGRVLLIHDGEIDVPWWSFTKTVIAAAAQVLVRDGLLALDVPLDGENYTLRQLLQHRAGLTDCGGLATYHDAVACGADPWPVSELLARTDADQPIYRPGDGWAYSNIGYLMVRRLIEATTAEDLASTMARLVLQPLGIEGVRLAERREHLSTVAMGDVQDYDPRWVYHGLLVGPLRSAALLLDRLITGDHLPPDLLSTMHQAHSVGGSLAGRPWQSPAYGLGLMIGGVNVGIDGGMTIAGHTGGGPGSVIAVYHRTDGRPRTAASFSPGDDQGGVERRCVLSLDAPPAKEEA
ncbi:MAG: serine hydrolase [Reyranella sp.]|nr:serine hydrolase [Reyranella sp.]